MGNKLSIIIPCYNCESTLEEAVNSIFTQNLIIPFEIVIVDDGSTDGTKNLILNLARKYQKIKYFFCEKNMGGGAARNVGIKNSMGDLIFCLDSDNFFHQGILQKMVDYLYIKKCEGVVIEERRFFRGNNSKKFKAHFNKITDRSLVLDDLFSINDGGVILDNFLFTRRSYQEAGGYPENHGFDTQCFEFRFMSINKEVFVCPGAIFYHRLNDDTYFQRVYRQEGFSINFYLIFEEIFYLFSKRTKRVIMEFDIFKKGVLGGDNIKQLVDSMFNNDPGGFYITDKSRFLGEGGFAKYYEEYKLSSEPEDIFALGIYLYKERRFEEALLIFLKLIKQGESSKIIYYDILRATMSLSKKCDQQLVEKRVLELVEDLCLEKQAGRLHSVIKKITNMIDKYDK